MDTRELNKQRVDAQNKAYNPTFAKDSKAKDSDSDAYTVTKNGKLILGIGRPYTPEEKKAILKFAKENGYTIPANFKAGIYSKDSKAKDAMHPIDAVKQLSSNKYANIDELYEAVKKIYPQAMKKANGEITVYGGVNSSQGDIFLDASGKPKVYMMDGKAKDKGKTYNVTVDGEKYEAIFSKGIKKEDDTMYGVRIAGNKVKVIANKELKDIPTIEKAIRKAFSHGGYDSKPKAITADALIKAMKAYTKN
jgi:hypothetical protein